MAPEESGTLEISISTGGADTDPDGYLLRVGPMGAQSVDPEDTLQIPGLAPGDYRLGLSGLAANCAPTPGSPTEITVSPGDTSTALLTVLCSPTTGSLHVSTGTSGPTTDNDGYQLIIDGVIERALGTTDSLDQFRLTPGGHTVTLDDVALYCDAPPVDQTVTIIAGQFSSLRFDVPCSDHLDNQIVFSRRGYNGWQLYGINPDGSRLTELFGDTNLPNSQDYDADISPDGSRIAFVRDSAGYLEIYLADIDGSNPVRLTTTAIFTRNDRPRWSRDGGKITFATNRDGNFEIYVMDADGGNQLRITHDSTTDFTANDFSPVWSPDGSQIAFIRYPDIYVMNADGTGRVNLTNSPAIEVSPAWSPDGTRIAFTAVETGGPPWDIFVMDPDGANPVQLTTDVNYDDQPAWSPDGTHLLFVSSRAGRDNIFVMNADGTGVINIHPDPGVYYKSPVWSVDR